MSVFANLAERARLLRTALTRRYIWTDLTAMVHTHGFEFRDVRANVHPLQFARQLPPLRTDAALPDFHRLGRGEEFALAQTYAWNSEPTVSEFLGELVWRLRARTVVELGCYVGWTSAHLALGLADNGPDARLWCLDYDARFLDAARGNLARLGLAARVEWVQGLSLHRATLERLPREIDLLFIDTSHEYQDTLDELAAYVPRISAGGCIALHDSLSQDGVRRALRERWSAFATLTFATEFGNGLTILRRL